jgi:plastocyanin
LRFFTLSLILLAAIATGLAGAAEGPAHAQSATVNVGSFYFCNISFQGGVCDTTIGEGSTVTWSVVDGAHTVTECNDAFTTCPPAGGFNSGSLSGGGTFSHTFNDPGTFEYWCSFHPDPMKGRIVVQAAQPATPTPAPTATIAAGTATPGPQQTAVNFQAQTPTPAGVPATGGHDGVGWAWPWAPVLLAVGLLTLAAGVTVVALARRVP